MREGLPVRRGDDWDAAPGSIIFDCREFGPSGYNPQRPGFIV